MRRLTIEQVIQLHKMLVEQTGGTTGLRDIGLLESALAAPFSEFGGISNYPSMEKKAARLGFGLIRNHPFVDGNKRIGILAMLTFLQINGIKLECTDQELVRIGLSLAEGTMDENDVLDFIIRHT